MKRLAPATLAAFLTVNTLAAHADENQIDISLSNLSSSQTHEVLSTLCLEEAERTDDVSEYCAVSYEAAEKYSQSVAQCRKTYRATSSDIRSAHQEAIIDAKEQYAISRESDLTAAYQAQQAANVTAFETQNTANLEAFEIQQDCTLAAFDEQLATLDDAASQHLADTRFVLSID